MNSYQKFQREEVKFLKLKDFQVYFQLGKHYVIIFMNGIMGQKKEFILQWLFIRMVKIMVYKKEYFAPFHANVKEIGITKSLKMSI